MKWRGTPEGMKPELEGPFYAGHTRPKQQYIQRNRAANVRVEEPVMLLLDEMMYRHGVSGKRLEGALGLADGRIKDMRRFHSAWRVMRIARQCFWAMGYDLQIRAVKVRPLDKSVVMTCEEKENKDLAKINGRKAGWDPRKMWVWLGIDKLEKSD